MQSFQFSTGKFCNTPSNSGCGDRAEGPFFGVSSILIFTGIGIQARKRLIIIAELAPVQSRRSGRALQLDSMSKQGRPLRVFHFLERRHIGAINDEATGRIFPNQRKSVFGRCA